MLNKKNSLISLTYVSSITQGFKDSDFHDIVRAAHKKNLDSGVSGYLIWAGDYFYQLLEGPHDSVTNIFKCIKKDNRHANVMTISRKDIILRSFMGRSAMDGCILDKDHTEVKLTCVTIESMFILMRTLTSMCELGEISKDIHEEIISLYRMPFDKVAAICYNSKSGRLHQYSQYGKV